jgi:glutathione synthase/RimK-type ligase-like ATP-grasp enzyme
LRSGVAVACDVLVIGATGDRHIEAVLNRLPSELSVFRLDVDRYPVDTNLTWRFTRYSSLQAEREGITYDLTTARVVWFRRVGQIGLHPALKSDAHRSFAAAETEVTIEALPHILANAKWINPFDTTRVARNKLLQLLIAADCGLRVPRTLVTNSPDRGSSFFEEMPRMAYKTLSSPSVIYDDRRTMIFTRELTPEDMTHASRISAAPCFFQEYIEKAYELRITCIADRLIPARIYSQESSSGRVDWRAATLGALRYETTELDTEVETALRMTLRRLALDFAAVDMIVTPEGEHVFLEANPHGAWLWLESRLNLPISDEFAQLITRLAS